MNINSLLIYMALFAFGVLLFGCQEDKLAKPELPIERQFQSTFTLLSESASGISFRNDIVETPEVHGLMWDAVYYGGGVGIGDINNDGLEDIFFAGNQADDALYVNKGDLKFENISTSSGILNHPGWSCGVAMVDINADGFLDIYVSRTSWKQDHMDPEFRRNKLFINNGDLTFSERSEEYGLDYNGYSTQATFLDFDKDGDLDMFLLNSPSNNLNQKIQYANANELPEFVSDKFYRNDGNTFQDVTDQVGVAGLSFGLGVVATDLNHDTWIDIYVANDYEKPDYLYINQRDGTFKNLLDEKIKHTSFTSMGCDAADVNNDGLVDLSVLDMQSADHVRSKTNMPSMDTERFWTFVAKGYNYQYMSNVLQLNNGFGFFSDIAHYAGVASTDWSWAVLLADFDNDSYKDMYVTNGINRDLRNNDFTVKMEALNTGNKKVDLFKLSQEIPSTKTMNYYFKNSGELQFSNKTKEAGLGQETFSFGAAYADLDHDGDLDLVVNNNNERSFVYRNNSKNKNHVSITIVGSKLNPLGIGTKVFIFQSGGSIQYQELSPVRGFQSSCGLDLHFGLGNNQQIDSLICIFPDDNCIKKYNVSGNRRITLSYHDATKQPLSVYRFAARSFENVSDKMGVGFVHQENSFDDFKDEILLPHSQSTRGPYQAVGDVNGDGLDDLYIGGATGQAGALYVQNDRGQFTSVSGPWQAHAGQEDMGCALFDADGDGDLDLYVASGGNASQNKSDYQDRLYDNDGKGGFSNASDRLPKLSTNSSCVKTADIDGDGDVDVFIGGLVERSRYPYAGQSVLLYNEKGQFKNRTSDLAPEVEFMGMVSDAVWSDIDENGHPDLVVVGEWMTPRCFKNDGKKLIEDVNWLQNAEQLSGWYMHVNDSDLNQDGKPDFILGNFGENNKFHPSVQKPFKVYSSDFDGNNTNDIVLAKRYKGKYVPVRGRECSSEQMPFIAEKFETFNAFANASVDQILEGEINASLQLEVQSFRSGVLLSSENGYSFIPFPAEAQLFPIMSTAIDDFNKDGKQDILIVGNLFDAEVETTRHDSGNGLLLLGEGAARFTPQTVLHSGFYAPFNSRSIALLKNNVEKKPLVVIGSSSNRTLTYQAIK